MQIIAGSLSERSAWKKIICDFLPIILYMYSSTSVELEASPLNIWPFQLLIQTQIHCNASAPCSSWPGQDRERLTFHRHFLPKARWRWQAAKAKCEDPTVFQEKMTSCKLRNPPGVVISEPSRLKYGKQVRNSHSKHLFASPSSSDLTTRALPSPCRSVPVPTTVSCTAGF